MRSSIGSNSKVAKDREQAKKKINLGYSNIGHFYLLFWYFMDIIIFYCFPMFYQIFIYVIRCAFPQQGLVQRKVRMRRFAPGTRTSILITYFVVVDTMDAYPFSTSSIYLCFSYIALQKDFMRFPACLYFIISLYISPFVRGKPTPAVLQMSSSIPFS